ncbi:MULTISPECIES: hypothetical protein [unclassified Streptomyces]|uniref:hypothetical protein n=1 Tax=unclassified Streptomyces TaxID=2593676 RepID=UPI0036683071
MTAAPPRTTTADAVLPPQQRLFGPSDLRRGVRSRFTGARLAMDHGRVPEFGTA